MNKDTIEVSREKIPKGYSKFFYFDENSAEVLDKLIQWSNEYENKNKNVYKHKVRYHQEKEYDEVYAYFHCGEKITKEAFDILKMDKTCHFPPYAVPYCDSVCYLDIYYQ